MYKLEKIIKDLKPDFFINEDGDMLYSFKNDDKLFFNDNVVYSGKNFSFKLFNKSIFIIKTDEKILIHKDIRKNIKINAGFFIIDEFNVLFNIYSSDYSKQYYKLYNFLEEKEFWTIEKYFGIFIKENNNLYASGIFDDNSIYKINLNHPEKPLWQFDLAELDTFKNDENETQNYQVQKLLGIHNEHLYVALSGSLLLELDIKTGKIIHRWENIELSSKGNKYILQPQTLKIDTYSGKLVSLVNTNFIEIDMLSKEVTITNMQEELDKYNILFFKFSQDYAIDQTHIYTMALQPAPEKEETTSPEMIIAVNKTTKKIDWHYTNEQLALRGGDYPKLANNKLYILNYTNELYIFEKEENETV